MWLLLIINLKIQNHQGNGLWVCLWGIILIASIDMGRPISIMGGTILWVEDAGAYRMEKSSWATGCIYHALCFLTEYGVMSYFKLLSTSQTAPLNCKPKQTFSPLSCFCLGIFSQQQEKKPRQKVKQTL